MRNKPDVLIHFQVPTNDKTAIKTANGYYFIACNPPRENDLVVPGKPFREQMTAYPPGVNCAKCRQAMGLPVRETDLSTVPAVATNDQEFSSAELEIIQKIQQGGKFPKPKG